MKPLIQFKNIVKRFDDDTIVLKGVNLDILARGPIWKLLIDYKRRKLLLEIGEFILI